MNYSRYHQAFSSALNNYYNINKQDVLDHPENYLGPNYKEVLNWWFYRESWSHEQWDVFRKRYWALDSKTRDKARKTAIELAKEVIDPRFVGRFRIVSLELIATHLYIERGISFTFLPLNF